MHADLRLTKVLQVDNGQNQLELDSLELTRKSENRFFLPRLYRCCRSITVYTLQIVCQVEKSHLLSGETTGEAVEETPNFDNKKNMKFYLKHVKYSPEWRSFNSCKITISLKIKETKCSETFSTRWKCRNTCVCFCLWYSSWFCSSCMDSVQMHILKHLFYMICMQVSSGRARRSKTALLWVSEPATQHKNPERIPQIKA